MRAIFGHLDELNQILDILTDPSGRYRYDPGTSGEFTRKTDSDNFFVRFDFNIADKHQLTLRHNFLDSSNHSRERTSGNTFELGNSFYQITDETNSTVMQLNSTFENFVNEARVTITSIKDRRSGPSPYPNMDIQTDTGVTFRVGVERFSQANALDQDLIELSNELTFFLGDHLLTIGTHNEFFKFENLFIQDFYGDWRFGSIEEFEAGLANRYRHSFSNDPNDPLGVAEVDVKQFGLYIGDEWSISPSLNVTMGVRYDVPYFGDDPTRNPITEKAFGVPTNQTADGNGLLSPRIGFNWDVWDDSKLQIRGGSGVFSGRNPYVWISNNYSNTGIEFSRVEFFGSSSREVFTEFPDDPLSPPTSVGNATTSEFNLIDPSFEAPQVWRSSIAADYDTGFWGIIASAEYIYTDNLNEVRYQNLNLTDSGQVSEAEPHRNGMTRVYGFDHPDPELAGLGSAYYLTNTDKGYQTLTTLKLERPSRDGLYWKFSYTNSKARSLLDGTSSRAVSNFINLENTGNPNNATIGTSDFEVKHRFKTTITYTKEWIPNAPTSIALFYNLRSGRPYSTTYSSDVNGDGGSFNDLLYVPLDSNDIILTDGRYDDLEEYISGDPALDGARGTIIERNASREPWNSLIDLAITQEVPIMGTDMEIGLTIQNLGNLLDEDSGVLRYANFNNDSILRYRGLDANGNPTYSFNRFKNSDGEFERTRINTLVSRWYAKLDIRWSF